jgi:hypothetical protein
LQLVVCDDDAPVAPEHGLAAPAAPGKKGDTRSFESHRAVLGVATVSLAQVAEGLENEGTYNVLDERGAKIGAITVRYVLRARPHLLTLYCYW